MLSSHSSRNFLRVGGALGLFALLFLLATPAAAKIPVAFEQEFRISGVPHEDKTAWGADIAWPYRAALGTSIAVSGDTAVIGAPGQRNGHPTAQGAVHVYARGTNGEWSHQARLTVPTPPDMPVLHDYPSNFEEISGCPTCLERLREQIAEFGYSVAIDGDTLVVGAPADGARNVWRYFYDDERKLHLDVWEGSYGPGAAYVFVRGSDGVWRSEARLAGPEEPYSRFGGHVDIDGDTIAVSSGRPPGDYSEPTTSVYARGAAGWTLQAELAGALGDGSRLDGDTLALTRSVSLGSPEGSEGVHVYRRSTGSWSSEFIRVPADLSEHSTFGSAVAIAGDRLAISVTYDHAAIGSTVPHVLVFGRAENAWVQQDDIAVGAPYSDIRGLVLDADRMHIGASGTHNVAFQHYAEMDQETDPIPYGCTRVSDSDRYDCEQPSGSVYVYNLTASGWRSQATLRGSEPSDRFGDAMAAEGDTILVGSPSSRERNGRAFAYRAGVDTGAPAFVPMADVVLEATGPTGADASYSVPFAVDALDGDLLSTCSPAPGVAVPFGVTVVTCTAVDETGNRAQTTFDLTVSDTRGPSFEGHDVFSARASTSEGAAVHFPLPIGTDAVDGPRPVACLPGSGSTFPVGITRVACRANDTRGNVGTTSFLVVVRETEQPYEIILNGPQAWRDAAFSNVNREDGFGYAVALQGDTLIVSDIRDTSWNEQGGHSGAVLVYAWEGDAWVMKQKLLPPRPAAYFGQLLALDGDTLVVMGNPYYRGLAFVYARDDGNWTFQQALSAVVRDRCCAGTDSIDVFGDTIALGSSSDNGGAGSVSIYRFDGARWSFEARLHTPASEYHHPSLTRNFGRSVSLQRDLLAVGAPASPRSTSYTDFDPSDGEDAGAVYLFVREDGRWRFDTKIVPSPARTGDAFGSVVDLAPRGLAAVSRGNVGGDWGGRVTLYTREISTWTSVAEIRGSADAGDSTGFPSSVAASDDALAIGSTSAYGTVDDRGAPVTTGRVQWGRQLLRGGAEHIVAPAAGANPRGMISYGFSVATAGPWLAVGAPATFFDGRGPDEPGRLYLYLDGIDLDAARPRLAEMGDINVAATNEGGATVRFDAPAAATCAPAAGRFPVGETMVTCSADGPFGREQVSFVVRVAAFDGTAAPLDAEGAGPTPTSPTGPDAQPPPEHAASPAPTPGFPTIGMLLIVATLALLRRKAR